MPKKSDRIWSQRSEAVALLAAMPAATATEIVAALFNSSVASVQAESSLYRARIAAEIRANRAREDALLAAAESTDDVDDVDDVDDESDVA